LGSNRFLEAHSLRQRLRLGTAAMFGHSHYSNYSAKEQQSKEELLVNDRSWEHTELHYAAPPPRPYADAPRSRCTKNDCLSQRGHDDLALSPHHTGPSSSNFSVLPTESETEQDVVNSTLERWVFDAGSDCEKCPRSISSTSCGSSEDSTACSSSDETEASYSLNSGAWPSMGSVGHPHMCAAPCKFAGKHNCKDGVSCPKCHICIWTRAKCRERAGVHRTVEMMSV